jgi:hypothetical protein
MTDAVIVCLVPAASMSVPRYLFHKADGSEVSYHGVPCGPYLPVHTMPPCLASWHLCTQSQRYRITKAHMAITSQQWANATGLTHKLALVEQYAYITKVVRMYHVSSR